MTIPVAFIRKITAGDTDTLIALARIYESSFPIAERKPTTCLGEMLEQKDYAILVAEIAAKVVGFAVLFMPKIAGDAALLEYMAVDAEQRGKGLGAELLRNVMATVGNRPLLVEVETGTDLNSKRRCDFYRRNGFSRVYGFSYLLPLPLAPPMGLMIANLSTPFAADDLARWLIVIYESVYNLPRTDARLERMVRQLKENQHIIQVEST